MFKVCMLAQTFYHHSSQPVNMLYLICSLLAREHDVFICLVFLISVQNKQQKAQHASFLFVGLLLPRISCSST